MTSPSETVSVRSRPWLGLYRRWTANASGRAAGLDAIRRFPREVERPPHPVEDARAAAELPALAVGLDTTAAADRHEGDLACAGVGRERAVTDAEVEVPPPRRFRRHVLPLP